MGELEFLLKRGDRSILRLTMLPLKRALLKNRYDSLLLVTYKTLSSNGEGFMYSSADFDIKLQYNCLGIQYRL